MEDLEHKDEIIEDLARLDIDADEFIGDADEYIEDRLEILEKPQYNCFGEVVKIGGAEWEEAEGLMEYIQNKANAFKERFQESDLNLNLLVASYDYNKLDENSTEGMWQREEFIEKYILNGAWTDATANEAGYIAEVLFAKYYLIPELGRPDRLPNMDRFIAKVKSEGGYFSPWDFVNDKYAVELKTVFLRENRRAIFPIPLKKLTGDLPNKSHIFIYWYVVDTPFSLIDNRHMPPDCCLYYFRYYDELNTLQSRQVGNKTEYYRVVEYDKDDYKVEPVFSVYKNELGILTVYFEKKVLTYDNFNRTYED